MSGLQRIRSMTAGSWMNQMMFLSKVHKIRLIVRHQSLHQPVDQWFGYGQMPYRVKNQRSKTSG